MSWRQERPRPSTWPCPETAAVRWGVANPSLTCVHSGAWGRGHPAARSGTSPSFPSPSSAGSALLSHPLLALLKGTATVSFLKNNNDGNNLGVGSQKNPLDGTETDFALTLKMATYQLIRSVGSEWDSGAQPLWVVLDDLGGGHLFRLPLLSQSPFPSFRMLFKEKVSRSICLWNNYFKHGYNTDSVQTQKRFT